MNRTVRYAPFVVFLLFAVAIAFFLGHQNRHVIRDLPAPIAVASTAAQVERHFDFGHSTRMAVPCWPGYECSEWDGRRLRDGRFSWAVIHAIPVHRQTLKPPIRRPDNN